METNQSTDATAIQTAVPAPKNGQVIYTCSVCKRNKGTADRMFQVQPPNIPARDEKGNITGIHCRTCVQVAREYKEELHLQIYYLEETLRYLAWRDAKKVEARKAAAEKVRLEANTFYQQLRVSNGRVELAAPESEEDPQGSAKDRRAAKRAAEAARRAGWDHARERAAGSYTVREE